ncbi:MAG TPA: GTPase, partial [Isosphaeraceae bacterium]
VALRQLAGSLAGPVRELRDRLLDRLVDLEANLDFVDEGDIPPVARRALIDDLAESARVLTALIDRHRARNRSDGRPRVVLAGAPNAGKSRLFNALLGEDRAIVAPVAGTTRDDVSGHVELDGLAIELVDTAGEELASSAIAAAAQSRRAGRVADADLVVRCVPADGLDRASAGPPDARTILIATKADLATEPGPPGAIATSALTGSGLASLRSAIAGRIRSLASEGGIDREIGPESYEALERAARSVAAAEALAADRATEELIAVELRQAIDDLGTLVGAVVSEDILDRIFRRFCVGK